MALRILTAALLSALAMFVWGFVFWGPVMNVTARLLSPLPPDHELDVLAPMRAAGAPDGMYVYPGPMAPSDDPDAPAAWEKKVAEGPLLFMAYKSGGVSPMAPLTLAAGLAHSFLIALLAGVALALVAPALPRYASRVGLLTLVGLIAALWTSVGNAIWWFHSPKFAAGEVIYTAVAGLLMALITAAIVKSRADSRAPK